MELVENGEREERVGTQEEPQSPRALAPEDGAGMGEGLTMMAKSDTREKETGPDNEFMLDGFDFSTGLRLVETRQADLSRF